MIEVSVRISIDLDDNGFPSNYIKNQLLTHKSNLQVKKCFFIKENKDKSGNLVATHYHGFIRYDGVTEPTFRKIFKTRILKMDLHTKNKRGNSLYCISKLRKSYIIYLAYMMKNIELLDYDEDTYELECNYEQYFTYNEYKQILHEKNKIQDEKQKPLELSKKIKELKEEFMSSLGSWTFAALVERAIKIYIEFEKPFRVWQLKMKLELWWLTKYPNDMDKYIEKYFPTFTSNKY